MEDHVLGEDLPLPPARLFERLASLPGYIWDTTIEPFHSTYDNWHVFGIKQVQDNDGSTPAATSSGPSSITRESPRTDVRPPFRHHWRSSLSESSSDFSASRVEHDPPWVPVVARISTHVVRLEREFHMMRSIVQVSDPECVHTVRPIELLRLPPEPGDPGAILVAVVESPGSNHLRDIVAFGPAFFLFGVHSDSSATTTPGEQVSLPLFLDFAIGACDCLELLHYGLKAIHGEIRGDAFHFNRATGIVKLVNTGNGARAFDNALGEGWSSLSREVGIKTKLQFVAPEQTGRLPTEPDTRTDIYALGVLFWIILVGKPVFTGDTPRDIVQNVLGKRIPPLSSKRMDIPDALSDVIQKMTQREVNERYHTITSVKRDLEKIAKLLGDGDSNSLSTFKVGQTDISSFFTLPSQMFGREDEYKKIVGVAEKIHRRHQAGRTKSSAQPSTIGSASSMSDSRVDNFDVVEGSSDSGSIQVISSRSNSNAGHYLLHHAPTHDSTQSTESSASTERATSLLNKARAYTEYKSVHDSGDRDSAHLSMTGSSQSHVDSLNAINRHKSAQQLRLHGRCEVITITGSAGIGKSDLIQRIHSPIRKLGYIGVARLDRARRVPFEPVARILASLLRQIFSESEVTSDYHNSIRSFLRPLWPSLHQFLGLPEQLISLGQKDTGASPQAKVAQHLLKEGPKPGAAKRPSFSHSSAPIEVFLSKAPNKNLRLRETYLDIVRILCQQRLVCVCLDDLQYADDETADLIVNIVKARIPCLLVLTARKHEIESIDMQSLFNTEGPNITKIELYPLEEEDVMKYVAATMHQSFDTLGPNALTPLSVVVIEKSRGNPFFIRMMLETCYHKNCIWYSWRRGVWEFDIDRIFSEFVSPDYGDSLGTDFLVKRFQEMPSEARSILIWAVFLGSPFSISLIQKLLTGEFWYDSGDTVANHAAPRCKKPVESPRSAADLIAGLQYLVQGYIILPGDTDDEFRFAHDRFSQAVSTLSECHDVEKMHFIIAQTLMKQDGDDKDMYPKAYHICQAARLIKERVRHRALYRKVLQYSAQRAIDSGARPTALWYSRHSLDMLQADCWDDNALDVDYEETRKLHVSTAELLWYQGKNEEALQLLTEVFQHDRTAAGKSRAWIIKSRISTREGDFNGAMDSLLTSLEELGVRIRQPNSYEQCDNVFHSLGHHLTSVHLENMIRQPVSQDPKIVAIGDVIAEAMAVAFWGDDLTFLHMSTEMMKLHLFSGRFAQIGLACSHLAMVAYSRYKELEVANRMGDLALLLFDTYSDPWSRGAGLSSHILMVEHLRIPLQAVLPAIEVAVDASFTSADPNMMLTTFATMAATRLYLGQDLAAVESFCSETPEELSGWVRDVRGGVLLVAVKQLARALQGKTAWQSPDLILSDDQHNTAEYMDHIIRHAMREDRPYNIYWSHAMAALYVFGHHDKAIEVGTHMLESISRLWSMRAAHLIYFYLALSIMTRHFENPNNSNLESRMDDVAMCKEEIEFAGKACEVNYKMWLALIDAMLYEYKEEFNHAIRSYEDAIDHCEVHGFPLEEALALELHGEFLVRRGAKRSARAIIKEAIAAWTGISAIGKAKHLAEKHEWLLKTAAASRYIDSSTQTLDTIVNINQSSAMETPLLQQRLEDDRKKNWVENHGVAVHDGPLDIPSVGLDIIDLSSILEFSQVMSSELQIDKLLTKMIEIILESCNGSDTAVIATDFEDSGFAIASTGTLEDGQKAFVDGLAFSEMEDKIAKQITHYTLRTKEEVLVHNVLEDERFSIVTESYQARYPSGRSVIALPIVHANSLLGVVHIEGKPNSFTQRNLVVLRLLCNQVGISLSNALFFRKIGKVSATNASMVETQKRALAQAREAEQKAKFAEAEANRNVKLKEDAARAKSVFLANVSHDLRTPMNGVIGLSELLKGTPLDKEQDGYVESIRVCADTLLTLINDILDFSKLEAGKMKISTVPLNLKETISEVVRALRYTHRDRDLETIEDLDTLPADLVVLGDPVRLHQIFMNLLSNSYKFTPKGSIKVAAAISREGKGRVRLECSVADTGIGISEEHKSRLFRPFSQADNSTARSYGGSGLGLSICKAIIEDVLGGMIWLESSQGVGTTVTFQLVFRKAPKETVAAAPWSQNLNQAETGDTTTQVMTRDLTNIPREQIRVCIAEDNPINQKIAVRFVKGLGLDCEAFSDGQQAVEALCNHAEQGKPFHVVLMDVQMPVLDGYDATRMIRKQSDSNVNQVLVIAMTASAIEGDREKCLDAGMNNYLAKPVRSSVLNDMLDQYLAPAKPKIRRRNISRQTSNSVRNKEDVGTPGSTTSSSSASQVIALTPEDERQRRLERQSVDNQQIPERPKLPPSSKKSQSSELSLERKS